jgi:ribosomal protein L11
MLDIPFKLSLSISSQKAETTPPLGTVLGNLGVNTTKFCKEFNDLTKDLPMYFTLNVFIIVFENRSHEFFLGRPYISPIISFLKFEKSFIIDGKTTVLNCINLRNVIKLAKFQFPKYSLERSLPMLLGFIKSADLKII